MDYIPINSIDDIDPRKISIRDINKRYVDRNGNRYATRFNLETRRVEVVQLFKNKQEALQVRTRILEQKKAEQKERGSRLKGDSEVAADPGVTGGKQAAHSMPGEDIPVNDMDDMEMGLDDLDVEMADQSPFQGDASEQPASPPAISASAAEDDEGDFDTNAAQPVAPSQRVFIEKQFMEEKSAELGKIKERQQIILNNLKSSNYWDSKTDINLTDLEREMDLSVWQPADEAVNYYRELYGYPRSVGHYMMRLLPEDKQAVESEPDETRRLTMIQRRETRRTFEEIFKKIKSYTHRLMEMVKTADTAKVRSLPANSQKSLNDALVSSQILIQECAETLQDIQFWKHRYP